MSKIKLYIYKKLVTAIEWFNIQISHGSEIDFSLLKISFMGKRWHGVKHYTCLT